MRVAFLAMCTDVSLAHRAMHGPREVTRPFCAITTDESPSMPWRALPQSARGRQPRCSTAHEKPCVFYALSTVRSRYVAGLT